LWFYKTLAAFGVAEEMIASQGLSSLESDWMAVNVNWKSCVREAVVVFLDVLHRHLQVKTEKSNHKSRGRANTT
jgi:hypothetical protein